MTDHLPECRVADRRGTVNPSDCICDRLRACEQRVLASCALKDRDLYADGYAAALDAAREAVSPLLHEEPCDCDNCRLITTAQALIAALRSEPALLATSQESAYQSEQP